MDCVEVSMILLCGHDHCVHKGHHSCLLTLRPDGRALTLTNHIDPAPNLLKANNPGEQAAMNGTMVALIVLGCWLVYSGVKSLWRKN